MKLQGKVAVVTGAASGMGKAIARRFAQEGAKVVVADLNEEAANGTVQAIAVHNGVAIAVKTNVADEQDVRRLFETTVQTYGTLDILVNNAGIMDHMEPAAEIRDDHWERVFAVNTTGVMRATRQALQIFLKKQRGNIINIASIGGLHGARAGAAYTASKHAVIGFTKNTGYMYGTQGIRCNAIAPGAVDTNIGSSMSAVSAFGKERTQAGLAIRPRRGQPDEIAAVALFLASADSSFVNGAVLTADGGWTSY